MPCGCQTEIVKCDSCGRNTCEQCEKMNKCDMCEHHRLEESCCNYCNFNVKLLDETSLCCDAITFCANSGGSNELAWCKECNELVCPVVHNQTHITSYGVDKLVDAAFSRKCYKARCQYCECYDIAVLRCRKCDQFCCKKCKNNSCMNMQDVECYECEAIMHEN